MHDYSNCYATLGVTPDTDWVTLRARYKRLMGQWHPDRFSADAPGKAIAEERSKQITLAYKALEKYRRDHGALPPIEFAAADAHRPEADPVFRRASFWDRAETGTAAGGCRGPTGPRTRTRCRWPAPRLCLPPTRRHPLSSRCRPGSPESTYPR